MSRLYEPDLTVDPNGPFVRDASNKFVRRGYWMDMTDTTLVMVMTQGIGADPTNDEKKAHLVDLKREHLIRRIMSWGHYFPNPLRRAAIALSVY